MPNNGNGSLIQEVFRQNWEHARHVELQRLQITNFYVLIIAALLAYFANDQGFLALPLTINVFLLLLTVVAFFVSLRLECEFHQHVLLATLIAEQLGVARCMGRPLNLYARRMVHWSLSIPMFGLVYLTIFSALVGIMLYNLIGSIAIAIPAMAVVFVLCAVLLFLLQRQQYNLISEECRKNFMLPENLASVKPPAP